jgi:hypothetical protein
MSNRMVVCVCVSLPPEVRGYLYVRDTNRKDGLYVRDTNRKDGPLQHLRRHNPSRLLTSASPWGDVS